MIKDFFDKDRAGESEAEYQYVLNNGVEVSISNDKVVSVRTFYNTETEYPVPVLNGIGGEDRYYSVVSQLGERENCAAEEIDIDEDGITEIIAYRAGKTKASTRIALKQGIMRQTVPHELRCIL